MKVGWIGILAFLTVGIGSANAQSTSDVAAEFDSQFYNATQCIEVREINNEGARSIVARNNCQAEVAALVCFRIIAPSTLYEVPGWYCDYNNLYSFGTVRRISESGYYDHRRATAACARANARCDQVIRSINVRVRDTRENPRVAGQAIRRQAGIIN
ncbi:MAG: hypothetical protein RIM33_10030 [Alphaproteobacteria bacterium]